MKFLKASRQPFVGLSLMAAIGIVLADVFPLPGGFLVVVTIILPSRCDGVRLNRAVSLRQIVGAAHLLEAADGSLELEAAVA